MTVCRYNDEVRNENRKYVHQNEVRKILSKTAGAIGDVITLNETLNFDHYADTEYQVEVALLTRNIKFEGTDDGELFGGHILATGGSLVHIEGIEVRNFGQQHQLGRYPFHMHLQGDAPNSYFKENSCRDSNWRAYVLHGTNSTHIERNVAWNIKGMAYYNEDGVEENLVYKYNLAAHVHPIYQAAAGNGQPGETFYTNANLMLPFDTAAAGYYIPNAWNTYIGNTASGGWAGFAFPNLREPIGTHWDSNSQYQQDGQTRADNAPERRPTKEFNGNTAHSSGFYWNDHGACIYCGGELTQSAVNTWKYITGRESRGTKSLGPDEPEFMIWNNTKTFLCMRGTLHWGDRIQIENYEAHDILRGSEMFGKASIYKALINGRSRNTAGWQAQEGWSWQDRTGFQFYDTSVQSILSHVTFRNYTAASSDNIVIYMTHSDEMLPQGINAVKALKFENCDLSQVIVIDNCGTLCGPDIAETQSGRINSVWDYDGSYSLTGRKSIIGSWRDWWNLNDGTCEYLSLWKVYRCDWLPSRQIGFLSIYINGMMGSCNSAWGTCRGQNADYTVGTIQHFGGTGSMPQGPWAGISGYTGIGWFVLHVYTFLKTYLYNCMFLGIILLNFHQDLEDVHYVHHLNGILVEVIVVDFKLKLDILLLYQ